MMIINEGFTNEATKAIHKATKQVITISDQRGAVSIEDRDIDELLS